MPGWLEAVYGFVMLAIGVRIGLRWAAIRAARAAVRTSKRKLTPTSESRP